MDHHCPWIASCVGFYNQKFFYQFIFYATVGDFIAFLSLFYKFFYTDFNVPEKTKSFFDIVQVMWSPIIIVLGLLLSFAMTFSIGLLFYYQSYFISNNITTVEKAKHVFPEDNIYYSPDKLHNFKIVLGMKSYFEWFIPVFKPNIFNSGYEFALNRGDKELAVSQLDTNSANSEQTKNQFKKLREESDSCRNKSINQQE